MHSVLEEIGKIALEKGIMQPKLHHEEKFSGVLLPSPFLPSYPFPLCLAGGARNAEMFALG